MLLNHDEKAYAILRSTDGLLLMPRYRLQHIEKETQIGTNGNINSFEEFRSDLVGLHSGTGISTNGISKT